MAEPESVFDFETELSRELVCWLDALLPDFSHRPKIGLTTGVTTDSGVEDLSLVKVACLPMLVKVVDELDH